MNIISAIGSFKGSINSVEINNLVKAVLEKRGFSVEAIPVADGGDGLLEALSYSLNAEEIQYETVNALGEKILSKVAVARETGIVEMALASGLALLPEKDRNPLKTSTYGTGILIKKLAFSGIKNIVLGIGGSATNDGGAGCLSALGFEFFDENGTSVIPKGETLEKIRKISAENVPEEIKNLNITIACDVTNPLLGENGATYIYAPQKGADDNMLVTLEKGMKSYSAVVADFCGCDYSASAGAGAAGGLGFALKAFLNAELKKGADIVLSAANFGEKLKTAHLVITGEGQMDNQTAFGKLPQIVASNANAQGVLCIALCGSNRADEKALKEIGINKAYELVNYAPLEECLKNASDVAKTAIEDIFQNP